MRGWMTAVAIASLALGACSSTGSGEPPAATAASTKPTAPAISGVIAGPFAAELSEADRQRAHEAEVSALESGKRQSWRGDKGLFGYVEPGTESAGIGGKCRDYSHTIYQAGRPKTASGSACRQSDGSWRATG